jgi:hypothetical protein
MIEKSHPPLSIIFGGESATVTLLDGTRLTVFVRELPLRHLGTFLGVCETPAELIELCTYLTAGEGEPPAAAFPQVRPPAGYWPVPAGWADNLGDSAADLLLAKIEKLNFSRAAKWGKAQIAAKKKIAPLQQESLRQILPLVSEAVTEMLRRSPSSNSSPTPASSPA